MRYKQYEKRFREIFGLPKDARTVFWQNGTWIKMSQNHLGAIALEWGIKYEGTMAQIVWSRGRPVFADGSKYNLAVIVYFADRIGLDTNHPYLQELKETEEYQKVSQCWQIIIE